MVNQVKVTNSFDIHQSLPLNASEQTEGGGVDGAFS
jgi:hypothetical protein